MIPVTKPFIPELEDYMAHVKRAFDSEWLTNRGSLILELEEKVTNFLGLQDMQILITNNGTIPLQIALKLLGKQGEIITTPFSYVATTSSIVWEHCTPMFVDIDPEYLTIDEHKIEAAITERTTAILATHVYGNPCPIEEIEKIGRQYNLKVIYDAAHGFGVKYHERSLLEYGDISTCSFHATKIFHTGEGGAILTNDKDLFHQIYYSHNFGHNGPLAYHGLGVNGKISELQAAMGLAVLPHIDTLIDGRKRVHSLYDTHLHFDGYRKIKIRPHTQWNYSYYPILFEHEEALGEAFDRLQKNHVYPRRYFYPALNTLPYVVYRQMPVAESVAKRILCLPCYMQLTEADQMSIITLLNQIY